MITDLVDNTPERQRQRNCYDDHLDGYIAQFNVIYPALWRVMDQVYGPYAWAAKIEGARVLDLGSGHGVVGRVVADKVKHLVNYDLSQEGLLYIKDNIGRESFDYIRGDAEHLPFKDNSFDAVTARGTLHHLERPDKAILEVYRVLKPGGRFLFYEANRSRVSHNTRSVLLGILLTPGVVERFIRRHPKVNPAKSIERRSGADAARQDYRSNHPGEPGRRDPRTIKKYLKVAGFSTMEVTSSWFGILPGVKKTRSFAYARINLYLSSLLACLPWMKNEGRIVIGMAQK